LASVDLATNVVWSLIVVTSGIPRGGLVVSLLVEARTLKKALLALTKAVIRSSLLRVFRPAGFWLAAMLLTPMYWYCLVRQFSRRSVLEVEL